MTYEKRNGMLLSGLDPVVAARASKALLILEAFGEDVLLTSGNRTEDEQNRLYEQGRTRRGKIVTHVRRRDSFHCWGVAFDVVPVSFGIPLWNAFDRFNVIARILMSLGFEWGKGMWGFDWGHFQYTQGLSIEDFYMGKRLKTEPLHEIDVPAPQDAVGRGLLRRLSVICGRIGIKIAEKGKSAVGAIVGHADSV